MAIVLFVFRIYSKRVKHELRETRNELQESARKRFSEEFYADIKEDNFYDNTEEDQKSPCYEDVNCYETVPEPPRYEMGPSPGGRHQPEYLDMFAIKWILFFTKHYNAFLFKKIINLKSIEFCDNKSLIVSKIIHFSSNLNL